MIEWEVYFREVLEASVTKHGPDKPLTLGHLLNIIKLADKQESEARERDRIGDSWGPDDR